MIYTYYTPRAIGAKLYYFFYYYYLLLSIMVGGAPPFRKRSATFHPRSATFKWAERHLLIFLKGIGAPPFQENERYWSATFIFSIPAPQAQIYLLYFLLLLSIIIYYG